MSVRLYSVLVAACAVAGTGCSPGDAPTSSAVVEFVYDRSGGLCATPDGGGELCRATVVVRDDGTWSATGAPSPASVGGTVPLGAASELAALFGQGWRGLTRQPFEGTCPTAYDGQESTFSVRRVPTGPGAELADAEVREVRSCTYDLTHRDAVHWLDLLHAMWTELELPGWDRS